MPYLGSPGPIPSGFTPGGMPGLVAPGAWAGNGLGSDGTGLHHPGAMRRGQHRHNNRSGPYDRRRNNGNGRLSPVRMSGMHGPGSRLPPAGMNVPFGHPAANMLPANPFPDAMGASGAPQALPPREAVQGRSLKSYEDLDAVGGDGSGELNY